MAFRTDRRLFPADFGLFSTVNGANPMLTFVKRPRRDQTIAADRKLWTSRCRQYRVAFSRCRYGPRDERAVRRVLRSTLRPCSRSRPAPRSPKPAVIAWRRSGSGKPARTCRFPPRPSSWAGGTATRRLPAWPDSYASRLYNAELNVRWNPCCRVTLLAGFRWIDLRENLAGALEPPTVPGEALSGIQRRPTISTVSRSAPTGNSSSAAG